MDTILHLWRGFCSCALLYFSSGAALAAPDYTWGTASQSGQIVLHRQVVLKRGSFPVSKNVWFFNGTRFQAISVGPDSANLTLAIDGDSYPLSSIANWSGLSAEGANTTLNLARADRTLQFYLSDADYNSGIHLVNVGAQMAAAQVKVIRGSSGAGANVYTVDPPVYISWTAIEGAEGLLADNGMPADFDGDGIPDAQDPDDDNDGTPDTSDPFPHDPGESNDNDHDGIGDNADTDDDNDGHPDSEDAFPYDPTKFEKDTDGDGVPDQLDAFPDNSKETKDSDGDGIGDNVDPKPNDPGTSVHGSGDGHGNQGSGDGKGGPGPKPVAGGGSSGTAGTGEFTTDVPDSSGEVKPDARHDVAGAAEGNAATVSGKIANYKPLAATSIGKTGSYVMSIALVKYGTYTYTFHFDQSPWPEIRFFFLVLMYFFMGLRLFKLIKV